MKKYVIHTNNTDGTKSYVAWSDMFGLSYCGRRDMAGVVIFDTIEDFEAWIKDSVIPATEAPTNNHILSFFPKLNPLYLNSKVRTLDTFSFYANPKAWIAQNEAGNTYKAKFNILMFPEFIGALTITTYHSAAKTIEVNMEQLSNRLKAIAESHIYKKA